MLKTNKKDKKILIDAIKSLEDFFWIAELKNSVTCRFSGHEWNCPTALEAFCRAYISWKNRENKCKDMLKQ